MAATCQSEYENCYSEVEGDYCLFHKTDKGEEEAEKFYEKLKEMGEVVKSEEDTERLVFSEMVDWSGYVFPELPEDHMDSLFFKDAIFKKRVSFESAVFEGKFFFTDAKFENESIFTNAAFKGESYFKRTIFTGMSEFGQTKFSKTAKFGDALFEGKSYFKDAVFEDTANFVSATFLDESYFKCAVFKDESHFWDVIFEDLSEFMDSKFEDMSEFVDTKFLEKANFTGATFVEKARFKTVFEGAASFTEVDFEGPVDFEGTSFEDELSFRNTYFERGIVLEEDKEYYGTGQAWKEASRVLKLDYEDMGEKEKADRMFVQERRAIREQKAEDGTISGKLSATADKIIADWTCEYGTNWKRLLGVSGILLIFFSLVYFVFGQVDGFGYIAGGSGSWLVDLGNCFYYSVMTFTSLGYGDMAPVGFWMKLLSTLESLIGMAIMVLIVVVFAREWLR